jgi:hypothetical protein
MMGIKPFLAAFYRELVKRVGPANIENRDKIAGANNYFVELNAKVEKKGAGVLLLFFNASGLYRIFKKVVRNNKTLIGDLYAELLKKVEKN